MTVGIARVTNRIRLAKLIFAIWLSAITNTAAQNFWQQTSGPSKGSVSSLAINSSGHIFAGTKFGDGAFRSTDNGSSWAAVNIGLTSTNILSLAINASGHIFAGTDSGVFRSTNNGDSWTKINAGLTSHSVYSFAINSNGHVFAGTNGGVFRSINNGDTWAQVNNGLTNTGVQSLAINPTTRDVFAGTSGGGIFRSANNGDNWTQVNKGLTGTTIYISSLAINSSGHLFAGIIVYGYGIFRSIDNGNTWTQVNTGLTNIDVASFAINSTTQDIWAGTNDGRVFRSTNDGGSWTPLNTGLPSTGNVNSLAINSSGHIFAGTSGFWGLRSTNDGKNWTQVGPPNTRVNCLAINSNWHIFAGASGDGLFRSMDIGNTWTPINTGLTTTDIRSLAINSRGDIFVGTDDKIFRSTTNGENWTSASVGLSHTSVEALAISPNGDIFAGTCCDVSRSTDNGNTWHDPGLISASAINVQSLAINSKGHIFVATYDDGVFRSINNGDNWASINTGLNSANVLSLAINASGHVFAGTDHGVFRSTNNGDTWEPANNGLESKEVGSFAINLKGHIFAGTNGVFRSIDNGRNWTAVNTGLTSINVQSLLVSSNGAVFAGTFSGGVFRNINSEFPTIEQIPLLPQPPNKDFQIDAVIKDKNGIASVILNYRRGGNHNFNPVVMVPSTDKHYHSSIPASEMTSRGMEYYFIVTDSVGNITYLPPSGIFSVQVLVSGEGEVKRDTLGSSIPQPNGSEQSAYRLISVPLALDNKSSRTILEDDLGSYNIKKWRFYELDADQKLREFPKTAEMQPGKAFWLIVKDAGKVVDTGTGISNRTDQKYAIPLYPMWNLIGNPFNFPIPVDNLHLKSRDQVELRTYTGSWNEPGSNPVTAMQPFEGYAIFVNSADTLLVNPDLSISTSSFSKVTISTRANQVLWSIRILAQCQEARDEDNIAGVVAHVSNNSDKANYPEPPTIGEYVSVSFPHPELGKLSQNYCTDFRPESSEGYVWPLAVATNIRDKVHLTFEGLESVSEENEVWLIDEVVPIAQNLRQNQSYVVAASSPEHPKPLKLVVGKRDFVEEKIANTQVIPTSYELNQNFPNPFNPATTIRYGLPKAERVTLKIYNLLGEEVALIMNDELQAAGYHVAIWDGRNKLGEVVGSGVYVYRFRAGSFTAIKKMALVK